MNQEERIKKLEARVSKLEEQLQLTKETITTTKANKSIPTPERTSPQKQKKVEIDWERRIGQVWLPRIFIFVLLLGVIWGFKAGTELGLISDMVRIIAGFVGGSLLLLIGHKQWKKQNLVLGQVMLGGAVAIFFLTIFSAHVLYAMIPSPVAFILHAFVVILGFVLTKIYQTQSIGIVSSIGAFLVPFLLQSESGNIIFFALYELVVFFVFLNLALSHKLKALYLVVTYGLHLSFLVFSFVQWNLDIRILAVAIILQHIVIALCFLYCKELKEHLSFTFLTTSVLMSLWVLATFTYSYWLIGFTITYLALIAVVKMPLEKRSVFVSSAALTLVLFLLDFFNQSALGIFLVLEGSIVIYLGYLYYSSLQKWIGLGIYLLGVLSILMFQIKQFISIETLAWTILVMTLLVHGKFNLLFKQKKDVFNTIKVISAIIGLVYLSQLSLLTTDYLGFDSLILSITWIIYASINVIYGHLKQDKLFRLLGVFLIFFTLLKVIFIDLPTLSIVVRAFLFLLLGGIGLAISRLFYKKEKAKPIEGD